MVGLYRFGLPVFFLFFSYIAVTTKPFVEAKRPVLLAFSVLTCALLWPLVGGMLAAFGVFPGLVERLERFMQKRVGRRP